MIDYQRYIRSLELAELQFKLAIHACGAATIGTMPQNIKGFQWGGLSVSNDYLILDRDDLATAGSVLQHSATYLLAVSVDTALENVFRSRFEHSLSEVAIASRIARIVRNAFSHNPFFPEWEITNPNHIGRFSLPDVIELDTRSLHNTQVEREQYGGPLALLRLVHFVASLISAAENAEIR